MKPATQNRFDALWIVALTLVVFFGRWNTPGLQPDAALYAGLSAKVLATGEAWRLQGSDTFFPIFAEHPPFFFQWGAHVLAWLGHSDGAARAIGAIPGALSVLVLAFWTWRRFGRRTALTATFMLATFGHFTKFAATAMLEAPLSLGVILVAIGAYEWAWGVRKWAALCLCGGAWLAVAAKGLAGGGAAGAITLSWLWLFFRERESYVRRHPWQSLGMWLVVNIFSVLPGFLWFEHMANLHSLEWFANYFVNQVGASMVTNRGDTSHAAGGSVFFYLRMLLQNGWPWIWCVPAAWYFARKHPTRWPDVARRWQACAVAFTIAYVLPFSLVQFQLAHYVHPIYLPWAPVAAYWLAEIAWPATWDRFVNRPVRWALLLVAAVIVPQLPVSENRGQPFLAAAPAVESLRDDCPVWVSQSAMDAYRLEAYALWYWNGHPTHLVDEATWRTAREKSGDADVEKRVFWDLANETIVAGRACRRDPG